ncbi:MAG TPA: hypothetical protein VLA58_05460 [Chitinophagaceae bacterium]|nr:hypothetical protein [Chitinophagaceae bacterium]
MAATIEVQRVFSNYYKIRIERRVMETSRVLFLMEKKTKSSRY